MKVPAKPFPPFPPPPLPPFIPPGYGPIGGTGGGPGGICLGIGAPPMEPAAATEPAPVATEPAPVAAVLFPLLLLAQLPASTDFHPGLPA